MFKTNNDLARFLNEIGKPLSLAELLELVVINHPIYWFSAKTVLNRNADDSEITAVLDGLFALPSATVNATWRETYRVVSQVRKKFLLPPGRVKEVRQQAREILAEYLNKPEEDLIVICDTYRLHYGSDKYFWYPLKEGFGENIETRIGETEPGRAAVYLVACGEISKEAAHKRQTLGFKAPMRWVEKVRDEYLEKVRKLRDMVGYESIAQTSDMATAIVEIDHPEGRAEIFLSPEKRLLFSVNGRSFSQHEVPEGVAPEVISQLVAFEATTWAEQGFTLADMSDQLDRLQYKLLQWPLPRWE
jgi:hypothetical protein